MNSVGEEFQKNLITSACLLDQKLYHKVIQPPSFLKSITTPLLNALGWCLGFFCIRHASVLFANRFTKFLARSRFNGVAPSLDNFSLKNCAWVKKILDSNFKTGRRVSVLILTSHPKTTPQEAEITAKIIHTAITVVESIAPNLRFKLLQAIDPFALDTLPKTLASIYEGFMAEGHLAIDRQPFERSILSRTIFKTFHYKNSFYHILKTLKNGDVVCMALAGGVAHNVRILYTIKEFAKRLFYLKGQKKILKNKLCEDLVQILTREESCSAITGKLSETERFQLKNYLKRTGFRELDFQNEIADFEFDLSLETPTRLRFFRALVGRLSLMDSPLLVIPIRHGSSGAIEVKNPYLFTAYERNKGLLRYQSSDSAEAQERFSPFLKRFVKENLNTLSE